MVRFNFLCNIDDPALFTLWMKAVTENYTNGSDWKSRKAFLKCHIVQFCAFNAYGHFMFVTVLLEISAMWHIKMVYRNFFLSFLTACGGLSRRRQRSNLFDRSSLHSPALGMSQQFSSNTFPFPQLISCIIYSTLEASGTPGSLLWLFTNILPV